MNRILVAGNWKLNLGPRGAERFLDSFLPGLRERTLPEGFQAVLFPPALSLDAARAHLAARGEAGKGLALGVQQVHPEASGAFTGENGAEHAAEAGAAFALVGHSERRTLFHETDDQVVRRVAAVLRAGLEPMVCVGETLDERREGRLEEVLARQVDAVLSPPEVRGPLSDLPFSVAYEPVWAIGTGETATPEDASEAHAFIRGRLVDRFGEARGAEIPILYGGSVKPENAAELLGAPQVGGVLVGGASLDPEGFLSIVDAGVARLRR